MIHHRLALVFLLLVGCGGDPFTAGPAQELVATEGGADAADPAPDATAGQADGPEDPMVDARALPPEGGSLDGGGFEDAPMAVDAPSTADVVQPQDAAGDEPDAGDDVDAAALDGPADAPQDVQSEDAGPTCGCATGCCVSGECAAVHDDGMGQNFNSCVGVGTFSEELASQACAAYAGAVGATCVAGGPLTCTGADLAVCTTAGVCWIYQGPQIGQVWSACTSIAAWN